MYLTLTAENIVLLGSILIFVSILFSKTSYRFGVPTLLLFLIVGMLFGEEGQADTYARKIAVAERAYRLLTEAGFPAEDIIFDPNILAVATGIEAHDRYALDFIEATRWIKSHYRIINVVCGCLLIVIGLLMATGLMGRFLTILS